MKQNTPLPTLQITAGVTVCQLRRQTITPLQFRRLLKCIAQIRRAIHFNTRLVGKGVTHYTLHAKSVPNFPFGIPQKRVYICISAQIYTLFSNHHKRIELCDDCIVNCCKRQIYYAKYNYYFCKNKNCNYIDKTAVLYYNSM